MSKYPKLGNLYEKRGGMCVLCGHNRADQRIEIQRDMFRGNDTVHPVHLACYAGVPRDERLQTLLEAVDGR